MKNSTANISTLIAVGGSLVALPAAALELGEAQINSSLGQPLRASIAYALAPNEALANTCVSMQVGQPGGSEIGESASKISVANGIISIAGTAAIREPIISLRVNIRCPYAAQLSRDYTMFVDPAEIAVATAAPAATVTQRVPTRQSTPVRSAVVAAGPAAAPRRVLSAEPVISGTRYQVQRSENLGEIAQRIVDRPIGLWSAVDAIFAANPDAFLDNDPNKLKAGSWLTIPDLGAAAPLTVANQPSSIYTGTAAAKIATPIEELDVNLTPAPAALVAAVTAPAFIDIPDTQLDAPVVTSTSPNVATARVQTAPIEETSTNWLLWFAGAGAALIAMMLVFGRRVRSRFASSPVGAIAPQERRQTDAGSRMLEEVSEMEVTISTVDELDDLEETQENLALDADLIIGSGLQDRSEIDVAQDFGFAAATELDLELPEEVSNQQEADAETDVIPPLNIEAHSILESEVLPDETVDMAVDADEYDMSVIVDATKMPPTEDVTMLDLEAIPVEGGDETLVSGDYTVSSEVDYTVLEQDYEDDLSATQALNSEIARAAEEIAESMGKNNDITMASVAALDITAQLPANNDDFIEDTDETGTSSAISDKNAEDSDDDVTVEIRAKPGR